MAETTKTKKTTTESENWEDKIKNLDMSKRVVVRSIAPWGVGFPNKVTNNDTVIEPLGKASVRREELVEQVNADNKLIAGIDGIGSHAYLYIEDEATRRLLDFDSLDGTRKQKFLSDEKIKEIFEIADIEKFKAAIVDEVVVRAEKQYLLKAIEKFGFDSYAKIEFCKGHCKFNLFG